MFSTLTINFSEVWPRQILELGKQFNLMIRLQNILKASLQDVLKTSWRCLENVFADLLKTFSKPLEDALARRLEDVLKTFWKRLEDVLKTYGQEEYIGLDQDVLKTSWRRMTKANIFVLIKMSWRRLEDVFWRRRWKTSSSRRMFAGINLLGGW